MFHFFDVTQPLYETMRGHFPEMVMFRTGGGDVVYYFTIINPPCPLGISHPSSPFNCSGVRS